MKTRLPITCFWLVLLTFAMAVDVSAQNVGDGDACALHDSDELFPSPYALSPSTPPHKPVIFGKDFQVPELHMRFVDAATGKPVIPKVVNVHYYWLWLEWPAPEHAWGAWSDAQDWVKCTTGGDDQLVVPARTVKPRGWYDGKYTQFPYNLIQDKSPKFDRLEIVFEFGKGAPRLIVDRKELARYKDSTAVLKLPYAGHAQVQFEKRSKTPDPKPAEPSGRPDPKGGTSHKSAPDAAAMRSATPTRR